MHSAFRSFIPPSTYRCTQSLAHSLTHSFTHSLPHSLRHSIDNQLFSESINEPINQSICRSYHFELLFLGDQLGPTYRLENCNHLSCDAIAGSTDHQQGQVRIMHAVWQQVYSDASACFVVVNRQPWSCQSHASCSLLYAQLTACLLLFLFRDFNLAAMAAFLT